LKRSCPPRKKKKKSSVLVVRTKHADMLGCGTVISSRDTMGKTAKGGGDRTKFAGSVCLWIRRPVIGGNQR